MTVTELFIYLVTFASHCIINFQRELLREAGAASGNDAASCRQQLIKMNKPKLNKVSNRITD